MLYKDFSAFAQQVTARVRTHAEALAQQTVARSSMFHRVGPRRRAAREILARDGITEGLVCIFSCVESCRTFTVRGDRTTKRLRVRRQEGKCLTTTFILSIAPSADARPLANLAAAHPAGVCQRPRMARAPIDDRGGGV